jgi:hypothetical protein
MRGAAGLANRQKREGLRGRIVAKAEVSRGCLRVMIAIVSAGRAEVLVDRGSETDDTARRACG